MSQVFRIQRGGLAGAGVTAQSNLRVSKPGEEGRFVRFEKVVNQPCQQVRISGVSNGRFVRFDELVDNVRQLTPAGASNGRFVRFDELVKAGGAA